MLVSMVLNDIEIIIILVIEISLMFFFCLYVFNLLWDFNGIMFFWILFCIICIVFFVIVILNIFVIIVVM